MKLFFVKTTHTHITYLIFPFLAHYDTYTIFKKYLVARVVRKMLFQFLKYFSSSNKHRAMGGPTVNVTKHSMNTNWAESDQLTAVTKIEALMTVIML